MTQETKTDIRKKILNTLRTQKEEERLSKSLVILEKLFAEPEFENSKTILFYASFDGEVDTFEMVQRALNLGKKIALPFVILRENKIVPIVISNLREDLEDGPYGIKQPRFAEEKVLNLEDIDMVVVPGIAFDKRNQRLGRGAGYYDRFLSDLPDNIPTIGLAFDFQVIEALPAHRHDIPVTRVIAN